MISSNLSNRLVFILSLFGLAVSAFLFYEYTFTGPIFCPTGQGCNIVRASPYSTFLGISIPILGVFFYLTMAMLAVVHTHELPRKFIHRLQLAGSIIGFGFGVYLTYLEAFVIRAFCFWCVISFIISLIILLAILLRKQHI